MATSVELYEDNSGSVYLGTVDATWSLGRVTPDMHGQFAADAHAVLTGEWGPSEAGGQTEAGPDGVELVATYTGSGRWTVHRDRDLSPAAHLYISGPLCTSCGKPTTAGLGVNADPTCPDCFSEYQADADKDALDQIQHILRDPQWGAGMLEDIAEILQRTGRSTDNLPDDEPTWDRH
jgi:hypothetical protein